MRPKKERHICCEVDAKYFKPRGIPMDELEEVLLFADEVEAIKLADKEHLYHEEAAAKMKVSRQTFGRIIESARFKIADALIMGKALRLEDSND